MKNEQAVTDRFERHVNELIAVTEAMPDVAQPTPEQTETIRNLVILIGAYSWVLNTEAEFKQFLRQVKLVQVAERLGKAGVTMAEQPREKE